jgi:chromosome segregation ATPase
MMADAEKATEKTSYEKGAEEKLRELGNKIDELVKKASVLEGDVRKKLSAQINSLKTQRADVEKKLRDLKGRGSLAWTDVRDGFDKAFKELDGSFKNAVKRFK